MPEINRLAKPTTWGILSGILVTQAQTVNDILERHGWTVAALWNVKNGVVFKFAAPWINIALGRQDTVVRIQKAKGRRQKAKGKRQKAKAKGKRQKAALFSQLRHSQLPSPHTHTLSPGKTFSAAPT